VVKRTPASELTPPKATADEQAIEELSALVDHLTGQLRRFANTHVADARAGHVLEGLANRARDRKAEIQREARTARLRVKMQATL
jgi:hypothetical protein